MIPILIDGQQLPLWQAPLVVQGVLMVPVRGVVDRMSDRVYQASDGSIVVSRASHHLILYPNRNDAFLDGAWKKRSAPAGVIYHDGHAYLPLRFVAASLGLGCTYSSAPRYANVNTPAAAPIAEFTPIPPWYPVVPPHVVITPTPVPRMRPTVPPHPESRRTPIPVGPFYRTF